MKPTTGKGMRVIKFRPLRRLKTGKLAVASYMTWHKVRCANRYDLNLVIDAEYKAFPQDEFVYNHKGEHLFWFDFQPKDISVFTYGDYDDGINLELIREHFEHYGIDWNSGHPVNYNVRGLDCEGTPTFSHITHKEAAQWEDVTQFSPLTVKTVRLWLEWFLYNLENSNINYNTPTP